MADEGDFSENDLRAVAKAFPHRQRETMPERGARERKTRLRHDGRSNRTRETTVPLRTDTTPEIKARLVAVCRRRGVYMRDFIEEALAAAFAKHGEDG